MSKPTGIFVRKLKEAVLTAAIGVEHGAPGSIFRYEIESQQLL
jgi:hypothetical protein